MLFRALSQELEGSSVQVVELINYAFIRDRHNRAACFLAKQLATLSPILLLALRVLCMVDRIHLRSLAP